LKLFARISQEKPEVLKKLKPVNGNLMEPNLGLSNSDLMMLLTETNIIFHIGATVNMQVNLREAFETNVLGTRMVLNIAKNMPNMQSMIYASTALSGFDIDDYDEKIHDWRESVDELLKKYESNEMDDVNISPFANNYAFSKRITELLIAQERGKLPISIVRPSIVTPSCSEPFAGLI
jgi:fatty acyl-CoA reductase